MNYRSYLAKFPSLKGQYIIVTGANSGIGLALTKLLASKEANVILACRNLQKGQDAIDKIKLQYPHVNLYLEKYDQADFDSIDHFVEAIKKYPRIDACCCNAGIYFPKKDYQTKDGFELTLGTNYIGVYYLIEKIKDYLLSFNAHIIFVTSFVANFAKIPHHMKDIYSLSRNKRYAYSKYLISCYAQELANSYPVYLVHPGLTSTNIISSEQTGFSKGFIYLGHRFLTLFSHSNQKACLPLFEGIISQEKKNIFIKPRGLFSLSGFPKKRKLPKYCFHQVSDETKDYIQEVMNVRSK
jgi:NAD(P)-dependent dehydrogenase (short-subunit alcohol dehydrogenase family)